MKLNTKKILLVHPLGYSADTARKDISRLTNIVPPLGLASIAAFLEKNGMSAGIVDSYARPDSDGIIRRYLSDERPAFMGLSCTTSTFLDGVRLARLAKSLLPDIQVLFGGAHVSALKERILKEFPVIDVIVVGEGEQTLLELMAGGWEDPASLTGVVHRAPGGDVRFTGYRPKGLELDSLPFPAYEKLIGFPHAYRLPIFNYPKSPSASIISSRGCPYACTYCDRSVFQRSFRYNSARYMVDHMRFLRQQFGIRHVIFYDDQFTFNRKRIESFTRMLIRKPLGMTFSCAVRAEHIDWDLVRRMKAAGCWMVSLGIETGDASLLARHRQNADLDLLANRIRLLKKAGIRTKGLLMMGLPGETEASIKKSMAYVFSLPLDDFNLTKFTPFPGSPIYRTIHEHGAFQEEWNKMDCMNFQFVPRGLTRERLEAFYLKFYKTHYMRLKVLADYATMVWRSPESWVRFIRNGADFLKFARSNRRFGSE